MKILFLLSLVALSLSDSSEEKKKGFRGPPSWAKNKENGKNAKVSPVIWARPWLVQKKTNEQPSKYLKQAQQACGRPAIPPKQLFIVGGEEATPHSWPWQARMEYYGSHRCGGTLVTSRHIVTAAHCTAGVRARDLSIVLGDHSGRQTESSEKSFGVSKISDHPSYNDRTIDYDVSVLTLDQDVTFSDEISPACMPGNQDFADGAEAYTTGWGTTRSGGSLSDKLLQVRVPIITTSTCRTTGYSNSDITARMICAGVSGGGKDACQGDSGGPLVCPVGNTWYLCGATSWGYGCAEPQYPGVYAKITELENWINAQLN